MFDYVKEDRDEMLAGYRRPFIAAVCLITLPICAPAAADVLLESNFTSTTWYTAFQNNQTKENFGGQPGHTKRIPADTTTAGFVAIDGPALQITIPEGENSGTGLSFYPKTVLGEDPSELYLRYDLRFGSNWANVQNGKLPGFGGTYGIGGWGGKPSNGTNGWSARGKFGEPCDNGKINVGSYVYHADMTGTYGQTYGWTNGCTNGLNKNQWYSIEYYAKVNTPGSSNGVLRGWIDGELVMEKTGLRFDDSGNFQIERAWMNIYHGGKQVAPHDMHLFIDNIVVSQEPIGPAQPIGSGPTDPTPNPPQFIGAD